MKVLVTGAGSGFGKGASLLLTRRGHEVIATTETEEQARDLRAENNDLTVMKVDITTDDVQQLSDLDVDVLVNNAGFGQSGPLADIPIELVRKVFDVNVMGTLAVTKSVLPKMIKNGSGRILIMSSIGGVITVPNFGAYTMSKHALEAFGKTLRSELEPVGIDVALINPGPYATGFNDDMANSMWSWFDDTATQIDNIEMFKEVNAGITSDQLDPEEVYEFIANLVEAELTNVQNFIPSDILEAFS